MHSEHAYTVDTWLQDVPALIFTTLLFLGVFQKLIITLARNNGDVMYL